MEDYEKITAEYVKKIEHTAIAAFTVYLLEHADKPLTENLIEYMKLRDTAFKTKRKAATVSDKKDDPKKPAVRSEYRDYISKQMQLIKEEYPEIDSRECMTRATKRWNQQKADRAAQVSAKNETEPVVASEPVPAPASEPEPVAAPEPTPVPATKKAAAKKTTKAVKAVVADS